MTQTKKPTFEVIRGNGEKTATPSFLPSELDQSLDELWRGFGGEITADGEPRWSLYNGAVYCDVTGAHWALFPDQLADGKVMQAWRALPGEDEFGWAGMCRADVFRLPSMSGQPERESQGIYLPDGERWYAMGSVVQQVRPDGETAILTAVGRRPTAVLGRGALAEVVSLCPEPSIA